MASFAKRRSLVEDGFDQVGAEVAMEAIRHGPVQTRHMAHREGDVGNRRAIAHPYPPAQTLQRASSLTRIVARLNPLQQAPIPVWERG